MSVIVSVSVHLCKVNLCYFVHEHKSEDSLQKDCDACHLHSFLLSHIHMYCMYMQCIEIVLQLIVFSPLITSHFKIHEWTRGISAPCSSCWSLSLWVGPGVRVSDSEKVEREKGKKGVGVFLGRHKRPKCRHAQEKTGWGFKSRRRGETSSLSQDSSETKGKAMLGLQIKKASQDSLLQLNELWHHANLDSSWQLLGNQHWLRRIEISY